MNNVLLGEGDNKFTNLATGESDGVTAGSGNDVVTNLQFMGDVDLGEGNNKLVNLGNMGGVGAGDGNDTLQNTKHIGGDVSLGGGNNTLTNSGELEGSYTGGSGTDIVTNIKAGRIPDLVDLGAGNDTFTGGNDQHGDQVRDHDGADSYSLNGGNDTYFATGNTGTDGVDTVNGGAGRDVYDASGATNAVFINLDTVDHAEGPEPIAANTAFGLDVSDGRHRGGRQDHELRGRARRRGTGRDLWVGRRQ